MRVDRHVEFFAGTPERLVALIVVVRVVAAGVIGAAWSGPWRDKAAYKSSVETTIVLIPGSEGSGLGTTLYRRLLVDVTDRSFHRAYAIIALPNSLHGVKKSPHGRLWRFQTVGDNTFGPRGFDSDLFGRILGIGQPCN